MRPLQTALGLLLVLPLAAPTAADPSAFPYKAYITSDEVYVRSGPGQDYYPTDKLNAGDVVEVYRHDPGGWYAVRPPKQSFSWVSTRYLKFGDDGLAEAQGDRVAVRVGSRFSEIRDVIQVRLDRGELVEVLQSGRLANGEQVAPWCKVAPPAGEFRWVYGKYVDPDFPADGIRKTSGGHSPLVQDAAMVTETGTGDVPAEADRIGVTDDGPSDVEQVSDEAAAPAAANGSPAAAPASPRLSPAEFQSELQDLELRLSMMVVEEPTVWHFEGLAERADALLAQARTAVERGKARILTRRIARFSEIKRRYDEVAAGRRTNDLSTTSRAAAASASPPTAAAAADERFDGAGRLTRVVSPKVGAPTYALMNEQGDVSCYVTPAPGLNLRPFEGKRIGVTGVTGLMLDPRARHVAVKHVSLLDDRRMR